MMGRQDRDQRQLFYEFGNLAWRGLMVTLVFTMRAAGLIIGPLLAVGLIASGLPRSAATLLRVWQPRMQRMLGLKT